MRAVSAIALAGGLLVAGLALGWAMGYVVLVALVLALPILVLTPSRRRRRGEEPGASGPGTPGYHGRSNVGDEGAT